jgi:putative ABC transport system ATP-binding protein
MAMRGPNIFAHRAWDCLGNGALFTHRIQRCTANRLASPLSQPIIPYAQGSALVSQLRRLSTQRSTTNFTRPTNTPIQQATTVTLAQRRALQTSQIQREANNVVKHGDRKTAYKNEIKNKSSDPAEEEEEDESQTFKKSEKAAQASQINLSAKLSSHGKEGEGKTGGGAREVGRLLKIAAPEMGTLSIAFALLLISSAVTLSIPFSIGRILDSATKPEGTIFGLEIGNFCMAMAAILALGASANYGRMTILRVVGERIVAKLRSSLFRRTFIQNAEFFDANRVGDLISRLGSDTIIVGKSITQNVSDGLRSMVSATAALSMMTYVSYQLVGILAIAFPPVAFGAFFYGRAIRNLSRRIQKNLGTLTKIAEERLGNVRTSQAFAGELQEVHRYNTQVRKIFGLGKREAFISATFFSASGFMGNATFLALLYAGSGMVRSGAMSVGDLTTFLMYTGYAGSSVFGLSSFYSELMKGVGAASRLFELQDREPTISPTKGDMVRSARGPIEFKNVAFAYPTRPAVKIFDGLNFAIPQGSNVAIVAPSGAGKSTVASLLMRFYTPTEGQITINGKDLNGMNAKQLRRKIGYVGQEPVLFSGTVAENIAYGKPLASRQEIVAAARKANCQFISDFVSTVSQPVVKSG